MSTFDIDCIPYEIVRNAVFLETLVPSNHQLSSCKWMTLFWRIDERCLVSGHVDVVEEMRIPCRKPDAGLSCVRRVYFASRDASCLAVADGRLPSCLAV